jgi:hypothetical protein
VGKTPPNGRRSIRGLSRFFEEGWLAFSFSVRHYGTTCPVEQFYSSSIVERQIESKILEASRDFKVTARRVRSGGC